jgi:hypothetical protein
MSDLKAPTYEDRHAITGGRHSPAGRAFMVRRWSFRGATFSNGGSTPKRSDQKAQAYKTDGHLFSTLLTQFA